MRFTLQYPMEPGGDPDLLSAEGLVRVARTAEAAGFAAVAFTEHPAPSAKWLAHGGHDSLDPLTALAYVAASTSTIRLLTYLLVLPYRNPLLTAKQATTVDIVSGGRLTLTVGGGYLRSEFLALGVDFEERNALVDEALDAMIGIWQQPDYRFTGRHFAALGQTQAPPPVQRPHPPLWIGGNSTAARRRVARVAQGWSPLIMDEDKARTTRTPAIASPSELATAIADVRERTAAAGRDPQALDIQVQWSAVWDVAAGYPRIVDAVGEIADVGGTWVVVAPHADDLAGTVAAIEDYGEHVIAPTNASTAG